jgi:hypothetical protein
MHVKTLIIQSKKLPKSLPHAVPLLEVENNKTKISIIFPNQLQYLSAMIKAVIIGTNIWSEKLQALV